MRHSYFAPSFAIVVAMLFSFGQVQAVSAEEKVDVFGKGELKVPEDFKRTKPQSRIVAHEFKVGEGDDAARLTMMAAGGGVENNIKRWKGQFSGGKEEDQKTEKVSVGEFEVHLVDVTGSYAERVGGGPFFGGKTVQREDYAMTGAIIVEPEGRSFFVKMIGPSKTVKDNRESFVKMIKSAGE